MAAKLPGAVSSSRRPAYCPARRKIAACSRAAISGSAYQDHGRVRGGARRSLERVELGRDEVALAVAGHRAAHLHARAPVTARQLDVDLAVDRGGERVALREPVAGRVALGEFRRAHRQQRAAVDPVEARLRDARGQVTRDYAPGRPARQHLLRQLRRALGRAERDRRPVGTAAHRQLDRSGAHRQRGRLGRRPGPGPVGRRDGEPQRVAGRHGVGGRLHRHAHRDRLAGDQRHDPVVTLAVGEVEQAARDQRRAAVRSDVAQAHGDQRLRAVGLQLEHGGRVAEQLEPLLERLEVPAQRRAVLQTLIARQVGRPAVPAPHASLQARELEPAQAARRGAELQHPSLDVRGRPGRLSDPAPRTLGAARHRPDPLLHVADQARLVEEAVRGALQRAVEEPNDLLEEADRGTRGAALGPGVAPGTDQPAHRPAHVLDQPQHRVTVAIDPATDREHRAGDLAVVLAGGALPPVVVAALVREPGRDPGLHRLQPLAPGLAPPLSGHGRVRRLRGVRRHAGRPMDHVGGQHAATDVVNVVGVAVVGGVDRDDPAQRRRVARGGLERGEAAP